MTQSVEINIRPIFSTPLLVFSIPGCEHINMELRRAILERETSTPTHTDHEVVGWSSPHDLSMLDWAGVALKGLLEFIVEVAAQATEFSEQTPHRNVTRPGWQVAELWANVQRKGGSNAAHPHPGTFWSGVYYVDVGDVSTDSTRGGELKLFDPRGCLPKMLAPYLRYSMPELYDAGTSISFYPQAGQCVMFPGWLSHAVATYTGDAPRISVAFNLDPLIRK
ncbi:MAG TPA: TIGR02466 family protein [Nitrospiraceae bacterium]|nr:TIGR02466 family protein [Nitrospiraceae bacterium]